MVEDLEAALASLRSAAIANQAARNTQAHETRLAFDAFLAFCHEATMFLRNHNIPTVRAEHQIQDSPERCVETHRPEHWVVHVSALDVQYDGPVREGTLMLLPDGRVGVMYCSTTYGPEKYMVRQFDWYRKPKWFPKVHQYLTFTDLPLGSDGLIHIGSGSSRYPVPVVHSSFREGVLKLALP